MDIRYLAPNYAVSGQIQRSDLQQIKALGFDTIINNRPDGEQIDQPKYAEIEEQAEKLGLKIAHIPMSGPVFTADDVERLKQIVATSENVFAFCRTGNRSEILWKGLQQVEA